MSSHPKDDKPTDTVTPEDEAVETGDPHEGAEAAGEGEDGGSEVSEADVLVRLAEENEALKERALRLVAEMENLRKRTQRDIADARTYGIANFARDMLTVSDNLQRALEAVPAEARDKGDNGLKALIEGVEMTERSMVAALERHGVKRIDPKGERFDPNFHQAMFEVADAEAPANTVVQVVQTGYVIGERVLRPAMVGVAKGGPKQPAPEAPANSATEAGSVEDDGA